MPNTNRNQFSTGLMLLSMLGCPPLLADELRIPVGQQARDMATIDMPVMGMDKQRVKQLFGQPIAEHPAKGSPPISSWSYQEFTVYFESDKVIHSVRKFHRRENPEPAQQPAQDQ